MPTDPAALGVPLFPLPNVVLFPRALLPLHVFEDRYRRMTADVLTGDRRIAMALLTPGWSQQDPYDPPVNRVVCVGTVMEYDRLADGRYNLLLRGDDRCVIRQELPPGGRPYRSAVVERITEPTLLEIDVEAERRRLRSMFAADGRLAGVPAAGKFLELLASSVPTADVADLIAFHLLDDVLVKQQLLSESDPRRRIRRVAAILTAPTSQDGPIAEDGGFDAHLN